jgi:glutathione peroxidase
MKLTIAILCISVFSILSVQAKLNNKSMNFYQFNAKSLQGKDILMNSYEGKVVLIVNTASKCGFTPQYEGLQNLYKTFNDKGLVILGFPCNQFASQEPGSAEEISKFCTLNYKVTFPLFSKIEVNGENAHPLYKYLKTVIPGTLGNEIKWNFTKFLLDRHGKPIKRYAPTTEPKDITADIERLLAEK